MYLLFFVIGALGFIAMTFLGLAHGAAGGHHLLGARTSTGHVPGTGHVGHAGGVHTHTGHANASIAKAVNRAVGEAANDSLATRMLMWVSPLDLFALALGAGATGEILNHFLSGPIVALCSFLGALIFDFAVVKPLMSLLLRFVSRPSEGLEGEVASLAEAITPFDRDGRGLVKLPLDGQIVQLLATLEPEERSHGVTVAKGEMVLVVDVDPASGRCRVSREMAPSLADDASPTVSQVQTPT